MGKYWHSLDWLFRSKQRETTQRPTGSVLVCFVDPGPAWPFRDISDDEQVRTVSGGWVWCRRWHEAFKAQDLEDSVAIVKC